MRTNPWRTGLAVAVVGAVLVVMPSVVQGGEARAPSAATTLVREQNLDANGLIRVHEQGTASVTVVGAVPAQQSGSWSVGLAPTANTVQLASSVASPVVIRNANDAAQPFQRQIAMPIPLGQQQASGSFTVPTGKRFVIEEVTGSFIWPDGGELKVPIRFSVQTTTGGNTAAHFLQVSWIYGSTSEYTAHLPAPARIYADPGTSVEAHVLLRTAPLNGTPEADLTVSGYLVDVP